MTRLSAWITLVSGALLSACGARTSQDELFGGAPGVGGQPSVGCCTAATTPGCDTPSIQECVCAQDSVCCEKSWDAACVAEVESMGCGTCSGGQPAGGSGGMLPTGGAPAGGGILITGGGFPTGGSGGWIATGGTGGIGGDPTCCSPHTGTGCVDPMVTACVCSVDSFCCKNSWDKLCVAQADACGAGCSIGGSGGASTGGAGGTGGIATGGVNTGGMPAGGAGGLITGGSGGIATGGSATGGVGGITGDCCTSNATPGCSNGSVAACVCKNDPYCCNTAWDGICVNEADACGAGCSGGGTGGSGGSLNFNDCLNALPDTCDTCACSNCLGSFNDCVSSGSCVPFAVCNFINNCACN